MTEEVLECKKPESGLCQKDILRRMFFLRKVLSSPSQFSAGFSNLRFLSHLSKTWYAEMFLMTRSFTECSFHPCCSADAMLALTSILAKQIRTGKESFRQACISIYSDNILNLVEITSSNRRGDSSGAAS